MARLSPWRIPQEYVDMARLAMGGLDLDLSAPPENALDAQWGGRVFLVPPMYRGMPTAFITKLLHELSAGRVHQAVLLTNNATETRWFASAHLASALLCLVKGRIRFVVGNRHALPLQGQAVFYFGNHADSFAEVFGDVGVVLRHLDISEACAA